MVFVEANLLTFEVKWDFLGKFICELEPTFSRKQRVREMVDAVCLELCFGMRFCLYYENLKNTDLLSVFWYF